jgi:hypothetical protein
MLSDSTRGGKSAAGSANDDIMFFRKFVLANVVAADVVVGNRSDLCLILRKRTLRQVEVERMIMSERGKVDQIILLLLHSRQQ